MISCRYLAAAVVWSLSATAWAQDLPAGWRTPTAGELAADERNDSPSRYAKASADLNRDGVEDEAFLLKSERFSGEALWVKLSGENGKFVWIKLAEIKWGKEYPQVDLAMGIDIAPPGVYAYGCFVDRKEECNFGHHRDRPKLKLHDPSLVYFKPDSSSSAFFWSHKYKRFLHVAISD
jgi:hypothetical protein